MSYIIAENGDSYILTENGNYLLTEDTPSPLLNAYTVRRLINKAYYLANIVSEGLSNITGEQEYEGLYLLNALLQFKTVDNRLIPFYKTFVDVFVPGQERYFIPNLVPDNTVTFTYGQIRFPMMQLNRQEWWGNGRAQNISTLPNIYYIERVQGGCNLYVYPFPSDAWEFTIHGKFSFPEITDLDQDLKAPPLFFDTFFIEYLRYALAEKICEEYNINLQPQTQAKLNDMEVKMLDANAIDFTATKFSAFGKSMGLNYGDINIGRGWRP